MYDVSSPLPLSLLCLSLYVSLSLSLLVVCAFTRLENWCAWVALTPVQKYDGLKSATTFSPLPCASATNASHSSGVPSLGSTFVKFLAPKPSNSESGEASTGLREQWRPLRQAWCASAKTQQQSVIFEHVHVQAGGCHITLHHVSHSGHHGHGWRGDLTAPYNRFCAKVEKPFLRDHWPIYVHHRVPLLLHRRQHRLQLCERAGFRRRQRIARVVPRHEGALCVVRR